MGLVLVVVGSMVVVGVVDLRTPDVARPMRISLSRAKEVKVLEEHRSNMVLSTLRKTFSKQEFLAILLT